MNGNYGGQAWVYRRGGKPCRSCGTSIQREKSVSYTHLRAHGIPFYVCAPGSSIDRATVDGDAITIEQRDAQEITHVRGVEVAAPGAQTWNPAFDITPAHLVTGFITEFGVLRPPYREVLSALPLPNQL